MQYIVNRLEKGKVEVKVDVPKVAFGQAYSQILDQLGKDAKIAGFRPGRAPTDIVEGQVGFNKILNQTASFLIGKHLGEILKKEDLVPLDSPRIAISALTKDAPFAFTATFSQKPKVTVGDWQKIKVKKVVANKTTDADINESIKNIYEAWKKQKVSKASNVSNVSKGEDQEGQKSGKFIYDAHGNKVFFSDEKKTLRSSPAEPDAGLKINDEFAKAIGARDLAHLRELVKKDLETIVADQIEVKLEQEIFEKLIAMSSLEVPEILVEEELSRMLLRLTSQLEQQGRDLDAYFKEQGTTIDEIKNKWREQAEKNVKVTLILDEIGREGKVTVTKLEVDQALGGVSRTKLTAEQKADLERYLALSIFQAKTLNLVKKTVAS